MPRPLTGRVGRSAGVAEHRVARHRIPIRLARTTSFTRVSALACVVALALAGAPSGAAAQTSQSVADARAAIDTTANQWFTAQRESTSLDLQIQTLTEKMAAINDRVAALRVVANARSVQLYESNSQTLAGIIGDSPLEIGRRAAFIGQVNSQGQLVIDRLEASVADLASQRAALRKAQDDQEQTLRYLSGRRRSLDTQLMSLEARTSDASSATDAGAAIERTDEPSTTAAPTRPTVIALTSAPTPASPAGPVAPPDTGRVSPHHNDPFLVCTRARESNSDYTVVSSSGYYGAYQFAPTTWNVTASHAGRLDLVGVLPSHAPPFDQDELAWSLYQWQGDGPWGGRC